MSFHDADPPIRRVDVLGVGISAISLAGALREVQRWIEREEPHYVCVTGVHGVMESQRDPGLCRIHNASGLTVADGMPMMWAGRFSGAREMERLRGPDLMPAICELAAREGWSSYFYGGAPGIAEALIHRLRARFPTLPVAGWHSPPFRPLTPHEDEAIIADINASGAQLVWVGLSTPRQEWWMAEHLGRLKAQVLLGVGAAFDVHAGAVRQAPRWVQRSGFEWAFRISQDPKRLWRRYLINNPRFMTTVIRRRPFLRTGAADAPADELTARGGGTNRSGGSSSTTDRERRLL